jgi:RNA polymerase sporulation-specific sigma factor
MINIPKNGKIKVSWKPNIYDYSRDREKEIIMLRYYKQKTQMQVSRILGITQVQVSRIERKILDNMRRKLSV